ncbi:MAG: ABC transporter substrate-binding protein, partial [Proteobacteria bacterium]|nr:ABC transporter substrate-binding protein [Pseudomonadota bacterium]
MTIKYWLLIIVLLSALFIWWSGLLMEKPIYIAISGPMSGTGENNGKAMVQGVQMYLDQVNQQHYGRPIKLLQFDDQNKPELAKQNALTIAKQSQALAVIGHYSSSTSLAAAPIYQQYGIPAISGTATADELTQGNNWYFRTIFNNSDQGSLLANYVRKILKYHVVDILFDEDVYGTTLTQSFVQAAESIGLIVRYQWPINSADSTGFDNTITKIIDSLQNSTNKRTMVFFATHSTEAVKAIIALRDAKISKQIKFIGADALSSSNFTKKMSS